MSQSSEPQIILSAIGYGFIDDRLVKHRCRYGQRDQRSGVCEQHGKFNYFNFQNHCPVCRLLSGKCPRCNSVIHNFTAEELVLAAKQLNLLIEGYRPFGDVDPPPRQDAAIQLVLSWQDLNNLG